MGLDFLVNREGGGLQSRWLVPQAGQGGPLVPMSPLWEAAGSWSLGHWSQATLPAARGWKSAAGKDFNAPFLTSIVMMDNVFL